MQRGLEVLADLPFSDSLAVMGDAPGHFHARAQTHTRTHVYSLDSGRGVGAGSEMGLW